MSLNSLQTSEKLVKVYYSNVTVPCASAGGGYLVPMIGWSIYLHPRLSPDEGKCLKHFP